MKYRIKKIKKYIKYCELMADNWRIIRDEEPTLQSHNAVIYFLSKRIKYIQALEKAKRLRECCVLQ